MSWTPEAVMIRGFKIPRDIWNEGMDKCEETNCLEDWEDHFIDMDPISGKGDTFFGEIVTTIEEGTAKSYNEANTDFSWEKFSRLKNKYYAIFEKIYADHNLYFPRCYNAYVGVRYI